MNNDNFFDLSRVAKYTYRKFVARDFYRPQKNRLNMSPWRLTKSKLRKVLTKFGLLDATVNPNYNFFWTNGLEAIALLYCDEIKAREELIKFYRDSKDLPIDFVDVIVHSYVVLKLKKMGVFEFEDFIIRSYDFLKNKYLESENGVIPYRNSSKGLYFIDTLGMICPFLVLYGVEYDDKEAIDISVNQMCDFLNNGFSKEYPFHAYDFNGIKYEKEGWGRGVGWMLMGMVDMLEYLPENHEKYIFIKSKFDFLLSNALKVQRDCGSFSWDLKKKDGVIDQSVTSMIGYSLARAIDLGIVDHNLTYLEKLHSIVESIDRYTSSEGELSQISGECISLNNYSNEYSNYPWGQAPATVTVQIYSKLMSVKANSY